MRGTRRGMTTRESYRKPVGPDSDVDLHDRCRACMVHFPPTPTCLFLFFSSPNIVFKETLLYKNTIESFQQITAQEMKMNKVLVNKEEARTFCQTFLTPYQKPRLLHFIARNKYAEGRLSRSVVSLEQKIVDFNKESSEDNFILDLRKLEVLVGAGIYKDRNEDIQLESTVAYVTAYPLDEDDASDAFLEFILEKRRERRRAAVNETITDTSLAVASRVTGRMQTFLHKIPCRKNRMLKLDVDTKDPELIRQLSCVLVGCNIVVAMETRGGYHVVIDRGPACQALWKFAQNVNTKLKHEDQWITIEDGCGPMIAIPGTNQGGFTVRLVTEQWKQSVCP